MKIKLKWLFCSDIIGKMWLPWKGQICSWLTQVATLHLSFLMMIRLMMILRCWCWSFRWLVIKTIHHFSSNALQSSLRVPLCFWWWWDRRFWWLDLSELSCQQVWSSCCSWQLHSWWFPICFLSDYVYCVWILFF